MEGSEEEEVQKINYKKTRRFCILNAEGLLSVTPESSPVLRSCKKASPDKLHFWNKDQASMGATCQ